MKRTLLAILTLMLATSALFVGAGPASAATDQEIADQGIIVAGDVPSTWTAEPSDSSSDKQNLKLAARTKGCKQYVAFAAANEKATKAASDDYSSSNNEQVSNKSYVHKSEAVATKVMTAVGSSTVADCLSTVFQKAITAEIAKDKSARKAIDSVDMSLEPVDLGDVGVPSVAYEGTLSINLKDGTSQDLDVGLVAVQVEQVVLTYSLQAPPDAADISDVIATVVTNTVTRTVNAL